MARDMDYLPLLLFRAVLRAYGVDAVCAFIARSLVVMFQDIVGDVMVGVCVAVYPRERPHTRNLLDDRSSLLPLLSIVVQLLVLSAVLTRGRLVTRDAIAEECQCK